jgi:hypothetical protein
MPHLVSDAQAEHTHKELMPMVSMHISYLRICSACAPVPYAYAQLCSAWFEGTSFKFVIFTEGIKNGRLKNGKTDACAQLAHQFMTHKFSVRIKAGAYP